MDHAEYGETSKKKNVDLYDSDRPLKKARYLWQVKGKYHLKETNANMLNRDAEDCKNNLSNDDQLDSNLDEVPRVLHNNNVAQARNKNLCSDRSCIEELIANSDKIMDYPDPDSPPKNIDKSISDEIPITLVKPNPENEDYYLRKWQARQIAKGFVDNTINRVLESWMVAPFDAADFVENCDNGGQVEDEGILMAIQSHGLQSNGHDLSQRMSENEACSQSSSRKLFTSGANMSASHAGWDAVSSCTCIRPRNELSSQNQSIPPFHHRSDNTDVTLEYYENVCVLKDMDPVHRNFLYAPVNSAESHRDTAHSDIPGTDTMDQSPGSTNETPNNNYDCLKMDDTDFLDAAVSVAIQKKGLTSYNCVDCG